MARNRETQQDRLLELLESASAWATPYFPEDSWVSLPQILDLRPRIASHTKIISNLREKLRLVGSDIECEEKFVNGEMHTRYRLVKKAAAA